MPDKKVLKGFSVRDLLARDGLLQAKALLHLLGWTRYDEEHVDQKGCDVGTKVDEYGHVEGDTAAEQEVAATIRGSTLLRISAFWGFSICRKRAEILSLLSKGQIDQI